MREEFYDVYREIYERYRISQYQRDSYISSRRWLGSSFDILTFKRIEDAVAEAVAELRLVRRLRPDAQLFLQVNLHQMVALPLAFEGSVQPTGLNELLLADTLTVLRAASEAAGDGEISGHTVIDALATTWENLGISKLEVWG